MIMSFFILIGLLSYFLVGKFRAYAIEKNLLDHPNLRSSHTVPTPRGGGIVFPLLWVLSLLFFYFTGFITVPYLYILIPPIVLISFISFIDDKYQLSPKWRFLAQFGAAIYSLIMIGGFPVLNLGFITIHWSWFGYVFMGLALLWSINLYNFMDGIDGIAAVEALFILGFGGYLLWFAGGYELALLVWAMCVIVCGFLLWNKPPAKIFMGDVGSTVLGLLVTLLGIIADIWYGVPYLLWVMLYGVFLFDATVTLVRRVLHGDIWYQAHRLHAYQRLQLQQWTHGKILCGVIVINIILAIFTGVAFYFPKYMLICFIISMLLLSIIYLWIERLQPMYSN